MTLARVQSWRDHPLKNRHSFLQAPVEVTFPRLTTRLKTLNISGVFLKCGRCTMVGLLGGLRAVKSLLEVSWGRHRPAAVDQPRAAPPPWITYLWNEASFVVLQILILSVYLNYGLFRISEGFSWAYLAVLSVSICL